eukprot:486791_1
MSVQLALLFTIWITQHVPVHNTNAKKQKQSAVENILNNHINFNFDVYKEEWVTNHIPFKFLTRDDEIKGEEGMFKQNAVATQQRDLLFKNDYILIPVGSTTSQPLIAKNGRVEKLKIRYAARFGARNPYPKLDYVKKFVQAIRAKRKEKFPTKKEKVPVIFIKSISWGLKPEKRNDAFKSWCEDHKHYMQQIIPPTPNNQPDDSSETTTYSKLRYSTDENDNFRIFLPDKCMGMGYKLKSGHPIPKITFAWADYFASEEAKKSENNNKFVAVGDIGGGNHGTMVRYKGGSNPTVTKKEEDIPAYTEGKESANKLFKDTQQKCEDPKSNKCKKASIDLAKKFIESIKKVAKRLNINENIIQVKQT